MENQNTNYYKLLSIIAKFTLPDADWRLEWCTIQDSFFASCNAYYRLKHRFHSNPEHKAFVISEKPVEIIHLVFMAEQQERSLFSEVSFAVYTSSLMYLKWVINAACKTVLLIHRHSTRDTLHEHMLKHTCTHRVCTKASLLLSKHLNIKSVHFFPFLLSLPSFPTFASNSSLKTCT